MKKSIGILLGLGVAAFVLVSCNEEGENELTNDSIEDINIEDVNSSATADAIFEDVDDVADFGSESMNSLSNRTIRSERGFESCAEVSYDEETGTTTIDFGEEGCVGRDGKLRTGRLHFTHTGEIGQPGEKRVLTFDEFTVDTVAVEGIRTLENISEVDGETKIISIKLENGKLIFPDETEVTRESDRIRTIFFDEEGLRSEATVSGITTGINGEGLNYTHSVSDVTPLLYTADCKEISGSVPVSGIVLIQVEGDSDKTVDYGDGTCDNLATVTQDGESQEIEVDPRQRRRRFIRAR